MMGRARFSLDELNTALVEVEAIINSRPLTYLSSSDLGEPLTPSHLLTGRRILSVPDRLGYSHDPEDEEFIANTSSSDLKERARHLNNALNYFWVRWRDEYLIELRETHRYACQANAQHSTIKVGDVVIIHDESLPRGFWKLARVEKVVCGQDGRIRAATVRLSSGQGILHRPVQLIYPLEVHDDSDVETAGKESCDQEALVTTPTESQLTIHDHTEAVTRDCNSEKNVPSRNQPPTKRSQRTAALEARDRLKALSLDDDLC